MRKPNDDQNTSAFEQRMWFVAAHRWRFLCLGLAAVGLSVSGVLLFRAFALLEDQAAQTLDVCSAVFGAGCDAALLDTTSWQFGIPLAGWGIVYYAVLVSLLVLGWFVGQSFDFEATSSALLLATAGAGISLVLLGLVVAEMAPFCPFCLVIQIVNVLLVPALKRLSGHTVGELVAGIGSAARYVAGRHPSVPAEAPWKVVGLVTAGLVAVIAYQWVYVEVTLREALFTGNPSREKLLVDYASAMKQDVELSADDPRLGPATAPVEVVVFSSFQCPACRKLAGQFSHLTERFHDKVTIVFKHYPLSTACNPHAKSDKHPRSCQVAWASEAARRQDKFWPFHDAFFATDLKADEETIRRLARETGLDVARFERDRSDSAIQEKVHSDIETAFRHGVNATPAVFLNGRRLSWPTAEALEVLIDDLIAKSGS